MAEDAVNVGWKLIFQKTKVMFNSFALQTKIAYKNIEVKKKCNSMCTLHGKYYRETISWMKSTEE